MEHCFILLKNVLEEMGTYRHTRSLCSVTTISQKQCQMKSFAIDLALVVLALIQAVI